MRVTRLGTPQSGTTWAFGIASDKVKR